MLNKNCRHPRATTRRFAWHTGVTGQYCSCDGTCSKRRAARAANDGVRHLAPFPKRRCHHRLIGSDPPRKHHHTRLFFILLTTLEATSYACTYTTLAAQYSQPHPWLHPPVQVIFSSAWLQHDYCSPSISCFISQDSHPKHPGHECDLTTTCTAATHQNTRPLIPPSRPAPSDLYSQNRYSLSCDCVSNLSPFTRTPSLLTPQEHPSLLDIIHAWLNRLVGIRELLPCACCAVRRHLASAARIVTSGTNYTQHSCRCCAGQQSPTNISHPSACLSIYVLGPPSNPSIGPYTWSRHLYSTPIFCSSPPSLIKR
jgi:hypothetical protein